MMPDFSSLLLRNPATPNSWIYNNKIWQNSNNNTKQRLAYEIEVGSKYVRIIIMLSES